MKLLRMFLLAWAWTHLGQKIHLDPSVQIVKKWVVAILLSIATVTICQTLRNSRVQESLIGSHSPTTHTIRRLTKLKITSMSRQGALIALVFSLCTEPTRLKRLIQLR